MPVRTSTYRIEGNIEQTPSGGIRVPARIARVGVLEYTRPDGSIVREFRPPEEVFSDDSMASFRGASVTDLHPSTPVTPQTYQSVSVGHGGDDTREDGDFLAQSIYIDDVGAVEKVLSRERTEISTGYTVDIDETPGEWNGIKYDRIQRNIRGNHIAILPPGTGRSGPDVSIRLDSNDDVILQGNQADRNKKMEIKFNGKEYKLDSKEDMQALQRAIDSEIKALESRAGIAEGRADSATKRSDQLVVENDKLKREISELKDPKEMQKKVEKRAQLVMDSRFLLGDEKAAFDGKTDHEIRCDAMKNEIENPGNSSEDYMEGAFTFAVTQKRKESENRNDSLDLARINTTQIGDQKDPMDELEEQIRKMNKDSWK